MRFVNRALRLAWRIASRAADDLHDLGQARTVADRQRVLAPNPVESFLRHAQGDDDVDVIAIVLLRRILRARRDSFALGRIVIHEVGDLQNLAVRRSSRVESPSPDRCLAIRLVRR